MEQAQELARRYSYPPTWDVAPINRSNWLLLARAVADLVEQIENLRDELDEFGEPRPGRLARAEDRIRDLEEQYEECRAALKLAGERGSAYYREVEELKEQFESLVDVLREIPAMEREGFNARQLADYVTAALEQASIPRLASDQEREPS